MSIGVREPCMQIYTASGSVGKDIEYFIYVSYKPQSQYSALTAIAM